MPYTNTNLLTDLASIDTSVAAIQANLPADSAPPVEHTRQKLVDIRHIIRSVKEQYRAGGSTFSVG